MLSRLVISQWSARKSDKKATKEIRERYGRAADVGGRYSKVLVALDEVKIITRTAQAAREYHYQQTLPWCHGGARILPAANYLPYMAGIRKQREKYMRTVKSFCLKYPILVEKAQKRLGKLFREDDYPPESEIASRFGMDLLISPLPDGDDFRVAIRPEDANRIRREIEDRTTTACTEAVSALWGRLRKPIANLHERISDPEAVFQDSLTKNVEAILALIPKLNITNDPRLEAVRKDAVQTLTLAGTRTLRANQGIRQTVAGNAAAIIARIDAYIEETKNG